MSNGIGTRENLAGWAGAPEDRNHRPTSNPVGSLTPSDRTGTFSCEPPSSDRRVPIHESQN
jgi:hypothetical protein